MKGRIPLFLSLMLILAVSLVQGLTLENISITPTDSTVADNITINYDFEGNFEAETLINWSKNGVPQGYLFPRSEYSYNFNEFTTSQTEVLDTSASRNWNNGTLTGYDFNDGTITGANWTSGYLDNYALEFDGVNDYVNNSNINLTTALTISGWFKPLENNADWDGVFGSGQAASADVNYLFYYRNQQIAFTLGNDTTRITSISSIPTLNEWYYITATWDSNGATNQIKLYINGTMVDGDLVPFDEINQDYDFLIGREKYGTNRYFNGSIDNVRIWETALTQTEIQAEMNSPRPVKSSGLVGSWEFEEGTGTTAKDTNYLVSGNNGLNQSIKFNGVDEYISLDSNISLDLTDEGSSVTFWVKKPSIPTGDYNAFVISGSSGYFSFLGIYNNYIRIETDTNSNYIMGNYYMTSGDWYHVALVCESGGECSVYTNGVNHTHSTYHTATNNLTVDRIGGLTNRFFNGSISSLKIWNTSLTQDQVLQEYQNSKHITEDNYKLNDFIELSLQTYNESASSLVYNTSFEFNVTLSDEYKTSILEGSSTTYNFSITNISSISSSNVNLTYDGEALSPTRVGLNYSASQSLGLVGDLNNSFTWDVSLLGVDGEYYSTSINRSQLIEDIDVNLCSGNSTTSLYLSILDEDNFSAIPNSNLEGVIEYWHPSSSSLKTNYSFSYTPGVTGYSLTGEYQNYSNSITSYDKEDVIDLNFNVKSKSIISYILGRRDDNTSQVEMNVYKGVCGTGTLLANVSAIDEEYISSMYKFRANLSLTNYSEILLPSEDYCLRYKLGYADIFYSTGQSYDSDIGYFSSQKVASRGAQISFQSVTEDPTEVCITPNDVNLSYNAFFSYKGGSDGLTHRFYVNNGSLTNQTSSIDLYTFNTTTLTEVLKLNGVDYSYSVFPGVFVRMLRFYPGENVWRLVQMGKLDELGKDFFDVKEIEARYKFQFYNYSSLLKTTDEIVFNFDDTDDNEITFLIDVSAGVGYNYDDFNYTYNETTKIFTLLWNDPTGATSSINLEAYSDAFNGRILWCNTTVSSASGQIDCNLSLAPSTVFVTAYRSASPSESIFLYVVENVKDSFYEALEGEGLEDEGVFLGGILAVTIMLIGSFAPVSLVATVPIGIIVLGLFGLMNFITISFMVVSLIVALVLGSLMRK